MNLWTPTDETQQLYQFNFILTLVEKQFRDDGDLFSMIFVDRHKVS